MEGQADGKAACDYSFHMGVTQLRRQLRGSASQRSSRPASSRSRSSSPTKGAFGIDDSELYQTLKLAKELGVVTTAHCENETLVAETQTRTCHTRDSQARKGITTAALRASKPKACITS